MRYDYDLLGNRIHQASMEAGERWMLNDVAGKPIRAWDSRGHTIRTEYDPARRPLRVFVTGADPDHPTQELLTERLVYGEQHPDGAVSKNLRGRVFLHLDQAGSLTNAAHDFKGNLLNSSRRIAKQYKNAVSWAAADAALPPNATATFDPLRWKRPSRPAWKPTPSRAAPPTTRSIGRSRSPRRTTASFGPRTTRPTCSNGSTRTCAVPPTDGQPVWTPFVTNIDYDAKGQRTKIVYGSGATAGHKGVTTTYSYDPLTFRLTTADHPA